MLPGLPRLRIGLVIIAHGILWFACSAKALESGDYVVIKKDAELKISGKVVGQVKAGETLPVHAVRGAWVQVGDKTKGWVRTDNVVAKGDTISQIDGLLKEKPGDPELLINRAKMYLAGKKGDRQRSMDLAEKDLLNALRADPSRSEAHYYLAQIEERRSRRSSAIDHLNQAIAIKEDVARYYAMRGRLLHQNYDVSGAAKDFEKVADLGEADAQMLNNLAWWLATSTDATARDGKKAIKYATEACDKTNYKNYMLVDTLAAAYAEANDFPNAIRWQDEAVRLCNDPGQKKLCRDRLKLYQQNQPYREPPR